MKQKLITKKNKKVTFLFFTSIKFAPFLLFFLFNLNAFSQDENISPIYQIGSKKHHKRSNNEPFFYYITDTLTLPIIDDFSRNHFQRYSKDTLGQNSTKKRFYKYLGTDNQKLELKKYASDLPKKIIYIPQKKADSIVFINVSSIKLKIADFSTYPVFYSEKKVYPNYTVFDTLELNNIPDTIWYKNQEFFQDSLVVFETKLNDKNAFWLDSNVYQNNHFAVNPWTIGVVTFDGLKSDGYPYFINSSIRGYGDYLTSKPINLDGLTLKDSIYFSFLYQPKGFGDSPENINVGSTSKHDSLCLQFYNPTYNKWFSIWSETVNEDPEVFKKESISFKKVHLKIKDSTFLKNNFQFRFVNYGDLSGSLDHFHLDYVKFRKNSGYQDTLFKDFAFIYPVNSILKKYTAIPWKHFVNSVKKPFNDSISFFIRNGSNIAENNDQTNYLRLYNKGLKFNEFEILGQKLTNGQVNYSEFTNYLSYHNFSDKINIPLNDVDSSSITIKASIKVSFTNLPENDSSEYKQKFADYYAYDDGSAEAAYGLKSSQSSVAYKFSTLTSDSLLGAYMFFSPTVNDKSKKEFALTVWKDNNGIPGEILYEDDDFSLHNPTYGSSRDEFMPYYFKEFQRILVDSSFFIGMRQIDKDFLNIGFDRNTNNISRIFYSMDKINWNKSQVDSIGSLMIRPIFVSNLNKKVSVNQLDKEVDFALFPNPANELIYIKSIENEFKITDIQGRIIMNFINSLNGIDISSISSGVYFVTAIKSGLSHKLVIE